MTHDQIQNFLYSNASNKWLESPQGRVYVRKGFHYCATYREGIRCLDIANIQIDNHNTGIFSTWYPGVRQIATNFGAEAVFFEGVLNKHFAKKLERMGMQKEGNLGYFDLLK